MTLLDVGPIHLGVDLRGSYRTTTNYHYRYFLRGPRLQVKPPILPVRPYLQASVRFGGNSYTRPFALQPLQQQTPIRSHRRPRLHHPTNVDVRLPEIGYHMSSVSTSTTPKVNLVSIGFGLVIRL